METPSLESTAYSFRGGGEIFVLGELKLQGPAPKLIVYHWPSSSPTVETCSPHCELLTRAFLISGALMRDRNYWWSLQIYYAATNDLYVITLGIVRLHIDPTEIVLALFLISAFLSLFFPFLFLSFFILFSFRFVSFRLSLPLAKSW